jgi:hypothetical protein
VGRVSIVAQGNENATDNGQPAGDVQGITGGSEANNLFKQLTDVNRLYPHCVYPKQALVAEGPSASFLRSLDIGRLNSALPSPVESQPHMRMLIHSCK